MRLGSSQDGPQFLHLGRVVRQQPFILGARGGKLVLMDRKPLCGRFGLRGALRGNRRQEIVPPDLPRQIRFEPGHFDRMVLHGFGRNGTGFERADFRVEHRPARHVGDGLAEAAIGVADLPHERRIRYGPGFAVSP